jgi:hypothetical protein
MNTQPNSEKPKNLTDAEFEAALHSALRSAGQLFPEGEEDIAFLEATLDMNGVPTPDTEKFRQLLRDATEKIVKLPNTAKVTSSSIQENLAMAARNGGEISEEVRRRMDADRAKAQEERQDNSNGADRTPA